MTRHLDEITLTSYALGELDPAERAAVEQALADDPEAAALVQELQALASLAQDALLAQDAIGETSGDEGQGAALTDEQRQLILDRAVASDTLSTTAPRPQLGAPPAAPEPEPAELIQLRARRRRFRMVMGFSAAAAALLVGVGVVSSMTVVMYAPGGRQLALGPVASPEPTTSLVHGDEQGDGTELADVMDPNSARDGLVRKLEAPLQGASDTGGRAAAPAPRPRTASPTTSGSRVLSPEQRRSLSARERQMRGSERSDGVSGGVVGATVARSRDKAKEDDGRYGSESYRPVQDNDFAAVSDAPLSTFSIDVDTASYSNVRRFLEHHTLPPADAVRIEELINYFDYGYTPPMGAVPFATHVELAGCPWNPDHRLARIGLKGQVLDSSELPPSNIVFLLDVSGSMSAQNKLPLVKQALRLLAHELDERDRVAIVVYAGASGLVLPSVSGEDEQAILRALRELESGGSTDGGAGLELAYQVAVSSFIEGGSNRVVLATDGDFNVGTTGHGELIQLIEDRARSGVFLSVLGFGMGNIKDGTLEQLADKGNGNYAYIDDLDEARKVLVTERAGTMVTIAKDVKIQVEFNPAEVSGYRLIGYENRKLAARDFNDDSKDAGEIGAGHTVTALYEIVPAGADQAVPGVDPLRYQQPVANTEASHSGELLTVKLRYKQPDGDSSQLLSFAVRDGGTSWAHASSDFKFAASVAAFGMLLRSSPHSGTATWGSVLELATEGAARDPHGYRAEFLQLVSRAAALSGR